MYTASVDAPASVDGNYSSAMPDGSVIDFKKVGKVYDRNEDVKNVIANEMSRIHKAFDVKLTEHTEHCVNTVNSGKPLVEKEAAGAAAGQKKKWLIYFTKL